MFKLPSLPYDYDALEGSISAEIMKYHHDMHHQTYVDKLNQALESAPQYQGKTIEEILTDCSKLSDSFVKPILNNGGGHYNHSLFWTCMAPNSGGEPTGKIYDLIVGEYGSFQAFVDEFSAKALGVFGSGWVFLQPNAEIVATANQDTPIMMGLPAPILCLDVWEHAYYLDYKNRRADYIKSWWNVVDWKSVDNRLAIQ